MKLGIMQPYFFPYLPHFALIAAIDEWIVFDITQYTPRTWMNRNRILHPTAGWLYITVPLSNSSNSIKIHEAKISNILNTKKTILGKLNHYKKKAPYFNSVVNIINETFDSIKNDFLVSLNVQALKTVCQYLNIPFRYHICSELKLPLPEKLAPGLWAPEICRHLNATAYFNPIGGISLFDKEEFEKCNITLNFLQNKTLTYKTADYKSEPNLSILDVLMWNAPDVISQFVMREYQQGVQHVF